MSAIAAKATLQPGDNSDDILIALQILTGLVMFANLWILGFMLRGLPSPGKPANPKSNKPETKQPKAPFTEPAGSYAMRRRANQYRKIAIGCFIASAAAAPAAAFLLFTPDGPTLAGPALYLAAFILYGAGTGIAIGAEELAAPLPPYPKESATHE